MIRKKWNKEKIFSYGLLIVCAILITVTGILFKQSILRIIPLYVSLVVGLLQSRASRFSYLLGGCNCIIYTVVYISFGLYATAASTLLFSCPIQLITFWRWSKRSYKQATEFRTLKPIHWMLGGVAFVICFVLIHFVLDAADSNYRFLDNLGTLVSLTVSLLSLLSFREYSWLMPVTGVINLILYTVMIMDDPAQVTYLIYGINSMICIIGQFFSVRKLYAEQINRKEFSHA
ncbi:MAG: nicotinamide mononucleotide transporter [Clostridia bacterium]|nr:nicotinamide mononucleotide transporter [Clostridia bacterium]